VTAVGMDVSWALSTEPDPVFEETRERYRPEI